jgi:hypothetical protein
MPISIDCMLLPFDYTPGSRDSLEALNTLKQQGISKLYESKTAQNFVNYKMLNVRAIGWVKLAIYCLFLLTLNIYAEIWLMASWIIYFSTLEAIQFLRNGLQGFFQASNIQDLLRILLLVQFIANEYFEDEENALEKYVMLTILSWLGLLE